MGIPEFAGRQLAPPSVLLYTPLLSLDTYTVLGFFGSIANALQNANPSAPIPPPGSPELASFQLAPPSVLLNAVTTECPALSAPVAPAYNVLGFCGSIAKAAK
jgi:hypothetical protein